MYYDLRFCVKIIYYYIMYWNDICKPIIVIFANKVCTKKKKKKNSSQRLFIVSRRKIYVQMNCIWAGLAIVKHALLWHYRWKYWTLQLVLTHSRTKQKQKYRGMFETQKSRNKTSSGDIGLNIRTLASPKVGQDQVSGGVSVLCWHAGKALLVIVKRL